MLMTQVPIVVHKELAKHLDLPHGSNWESFCSALRYSPKDIDASLIWILVTSLNFQPLDVEDITTNCLSQGCSLMWGSSHFQIGLLIIGTRYPMMWLMQEVSTVSKTDLMMKLRKWIKYLAEVRGNGSYTLKFFEVYGDKLLVAEVLQALKAIENLPCIDILAEYVKSYAQTNFGTTLGAAQVSSQRNPKQHERNAVSYDSSSDLMKFSSDRNDIKSSSSLRNYGNHPSKQPNISRASVMPMQQMKESQQQRGVDTMQWSPEPYCKPEISEEYLSKSKNVYQKQDVEFKPYENYTAQYKTEKRDAQNYQPHKNDDSYFMKAENKCSPMRQPPGKYEDEKVKYGIDVNRVPSNSSFSQLNLKSDSLSTDFYAPSEGKIDSTNESCGGSTSNSLRSYTMDGKSGVISNEEDSDSESAEVWNKVKNIGCDLKPSAPPSVPVVENGGLVARGIGTFLYQSNTSLISESGSMIGNINSCQAMSCESLNGRLDCGPPREERPVPGPIGLARTAYGLASLSAADKPNPMPNYSQDQAMGLDLTMKPNQNSSSVSTTASYAVDLSCQDIRISNIKEGSRLARLGEREYPYDSKSSRMSDDPWSSPTGSVSSRDSSSYKVMLDKPNLSPQTDNFSHYRHQNSAASHKHTHQNFPMQNAEQIIQYNRDNRSMAMEGGRGHYPNGALPHRDSQINPEAYRDSSMHAPYKGASPMSQQSNSPGMYPHRMHPQMEQVNPYQHNRGPNMGPYGVPGHNSERILMHPSHLNPNNHYAISRLNPVMEKGLAPCESDSRNKVVDMVIDWLNTSCGMNDGPPKNSPAAEKKQNITPGQHEAANAKPKDDVAAKAVSTKVKNETETKPEEPTKSRMKRFTDPLTDKDKAEIEKLSSSAGDMKNKELNKRVTTPKSSASSVLESTPFKCDKRRIRVFVTYSVDSKKHLKAVMNLCKCLKKNEFSVSLDVRESPLVACDRIGWIDGRLKVVDYVLVLISPQYLRDVSVTEDDIARSTTCPSDSSLNALYIHRWMQNEYRKNLCINRRFIPVIMPDASRDQIPVWLQNTIPYVWPQQYEDLFFFMTRPMRVLREFADNKHNNNNNDDDGSKQIVVSRS